MTDDLKAPERTFDHSYELSHSDGEWWTLKSNGFVVASFSLKTWGSAERIIEAAWQYAYGQPDADLYATLEAALADMTQQRDAAMAGAVKVKPLFWNESNEAQVGGLCYFVINDRRFGWAWARSGSPFEYGTEDEKVAKDAARADYETITRSMWQPDPDRLLALTAAAEAQAEARGMRKAATELPHRVENLGGQSYAYVRVEEVLALADANEAAAKGGV